MSVIAAQFVIKSRLSLAGNGAVKVSRSRVPKTRQAKSPEVASPCELEKLRVFSGSFAGSCVFFHVEGNKAAAVAY